jgi:phage terminase Nu1 subunit (DNA packaging protein)
MVEFTVSEINFICIYVGDTKEETIANIMDSIPNLYEKELVEIAEQSIIKLDTLTESEFAQANFVECFTE